MSLGGGVGSRALNSWRRLRLASVAIGRGLMSNIKGQTETPWQEIIMHLIQFILYSAIRLIVLTYIRIMSFHALKSSMTISYGMKNEHLFCQNPLTAPYLFPPSSLCP